MNQPWIYMCSPSWSPFPPPSPSHPSGSSQCTSRVQFWVKLVSALRPTSSFSCLFLLRFSSGTPTPYTGKTRLFFFLPCWPLGVCPGRSLPGFFLWALGTLWPSAHPLGGLAPTSSIIRAYLSTGGRMWRARRDRPKLPEGPSTVVQSRDLGTLTKLGHLKHLLSKLLNFSELPFPCT